MDTGELQSEPTRTSLFKMRGVGQFVLVSILMMLTYLVMAKFYGDPNLSGPRLNRELVIWPIVFILVFLYWYGYTLIKMDSIPRPLIVMLGVIVALAAVLVPPFHSTDIYGYINRGWQQVAYDLNPYVYTVDAIPGWEKDPMITDHWVNNPSPYGFFYLQIAKGLCTIAGENLLRAIAVFKGFNFLVHLAIGALIWLSTKRLGLKLDQAVYLYAFNPLILVHTLSNGHNDSLMGFFILIGVYFAVIRFWMGIIPALVAATLIKYGALLILPLAVLFLIKQKAWRDLMIGAVLGALVFVGSGYEYLGDFDRFHLKEIERNAFVSHASLHSVFNWMFKAISNEIIPALEPYRNAFRTMAKNILLLGFAAYYVVKVFKIRKMPTYSVQDWIHDAVLMMVVLICVVSLKFYAWYLAMFFPLAMLLAPGDQLRNFVLLLSGFQMLGLTFIGQAHFLNYMLMTALPYFVIVQFANKQKAIEASEGRHMFDKSPPA